LHKPDIIALAQQVNWRAAPKTVIFHGSRGRGAAGGAKRLVKDWIAWRDKSLP